MQVILRDTIKSSSLYQGKENAIYVFTTKTVFAVFIITEFGTNTVGHSYLIKVMMAVCLVNANGGDNIF